jgi:iron-sulfur cluster repair protein YtfE (RIC family)
MKVKIPEPLKLEHQELHAELVRATKAGGKTEEAAKSVAKVLHNHFVKEEEFALPPLGLLPLLAQGKVDHKMRNILGMTDRLKAELPDMLREHKAVVTALKKLMTAAKKEKKPEHAHFAEKLALHAKTEEDVLYPAAILIGEYLKLRLAPV